MLTHPIYEARIEEMLRCEPELSIPVIHQQLRSMGTIIKRNETCELVWSMVDRGQLTRTTTVRERRYCLVFARHILLR